MQTYNNSQEYRDFFKTKIQRTAQLDDTDQNKYLVQLRQTATILKWITHVNFWKFKKIKIKSFNLNHCVSWFMKHTLRYRKVHKYCICKFNQLVWPCKLDYIVHKYNKENIQLTLKTNHTSFKMSFKLYTLLPMQRLTDCYKGIHFPIEIASCEYQSWIPL